jgi:hypothetical protein
MLTISEGIWYSKDGMHIDPKYYCGSPFSYGAELDNDWIVNQSLTLPYDANKKELKALF